ncbi:Tripartite tricarboxylate transporter family receptor [Pigmentiphaga humi]|uniref:Tripartite tricarboxylate transporter family receptor n=1 Tax=Pigmentiphaga humi TaxID=2478468 RepID=A0A3P4AZC8_9BURK|nr:tripartite tricarboxylate transporter substrate binding protein [Pigmentiphaga humi]VCU68921.1 Tripartite tricarboxylate transporter family receptor [Pigmentiphaga humi]
MHAFRHGRRLAALLLTLAASAPLAQAAEPAWPQRPVRLLVPYAAGGSTDIASRLIAQRLAQTLGQPVVVENRAGAAGSVGAAYFAKASPDDHFFMMITPSQLSINPYLYKTDLGYDADKDFVAIGLATQTPNAIVVSPSLNVKSLGELVEYARANPRKVAYSSAGIGSTGHLLNELIKTLTKIDILHVPYRGNGPAMQALLAGEVQFNTDNLPQLLPQIQAGKVRPIAVTTRERWFQLPDVPTVAEAGYPSLATSVWFGMVGQASLPKPVVARMNQALNTVLTDPAFVEKLKEVSLEATPSTPEEMAAHVRAEAQRWAKVIKESGATAD